MTDIELRLLAELITKLKQTRPEFEVLITDAKPDALHKLVHESKDFYCQLDCQIEIHFDDKLNDVLVDRV